MLVYFHRADDWLEEHLGDDYLHAFRDGYGVEIEDDTYTLEQLILDNPKRAENTLREGWADGRDTAIGLVPPGSSSFPQCVTRRYPSEPSSTTLGFSYLLDMYGCLPGVADNLELHYGFLETLVDRLQITRMSQPAVIHGPRNHGDEIYPDKAGVSGWVPLIESGIQIHSIEPTHFITLDVYSCKPFKPQTVWEFAKQLFEFQNFEDHFIERGRSYVGG